MIGSRSESSFANFPFRTGATFAFGLLVGAGIWTELSLLTRGFLPTFFLAAGADASTTGAALLPVAVRALVVLVAIGIAVVVVVLALNDALVAVGLLDMG